MLLEITDVWNVFVAIHEYCASSNNVTFFINSTPIPSSETTTYLGSVFKGCRFLYHVTVGVGVPSAMQVSDGLEPWWTLILGIGSTMIIGGAIWAKIYNYYLI